MQAYFWSVSAEQIFITAILEKEAQEGWSEWKATPREDDQPRLFSWTGRGLYSQRRT